MLGSGRIGSEEMDPRTTLRYIKNIRQAKAECVQYKTKRTSMHSFTISCSILCDLYSAYSPLPDDLKVLSVHFILLPVAAF